MGQPCKICGDLTDAKSVTCYACSRKSTLTDLDVVEMPATDMKFDGGKRRYDLVPFEAIDAVADVLTFGAGKYGDNTWKQVSNGSERYMGAMLRHISAVRQGEYLDPESGLPHAAHILCNAAFFFILTKPQPSSSGG